MMEAKDTVMTLLQLHQKAKGKTYLEAQAEISFKAGEKQGIRKAIDNLKMHHCIVDIEARIKEIEDG